MNNHDDFDGQEGFSGVGPKGTRTREPYVPPQKVLVPCPTCGATVLRAAMRQGRMERLPVPLTPVLGYEHRCAEAEHHAE